MRTHALSFAALALVAAIAGCGGHPVQSALDSNQSLWTTKRPTTYRFTFNWLCFCSQEYTAPVEIQVENNAIKSIVDAGTTNAVPMARWKDYKTIDGLFAFIQEAVGRNADKIDATYDAQLGYPKNVEIDYVQNASDEEMSFRVTAYSAP